jgi:hypothetical protein
VYRLDLKIEYYEEIRRVEIVFAPYTYEPAVFVDGPSSPHRYGGGQLCMWHPDAPPDERWVWNEGLFSLIGLIRTHLFREAWWREFGEWLGPEAPHGELKRHDNDVPAADAA